MIHTLFESWDVPLYHTKISKLLLSFPFHTGWIFQKHANTWAVFWATVCSPLNLLYSTVLYSSTNYVQLNPSQQHWLHNSFQDNTIEWVLAPLTATATSQAKKMCKIVRAIIHFQSVASSSGIWRWDISTTTKKMSFKPQRWRSKERSRSWHLNIMVHHHHHYQILILTLTAVVDNVVMEIKPIMVSWKKARLFNVSPAMLGHI